MSLPSILLSVAAIAALVTRIATSDKITEPLRDRTTGTLNYFLNCPKCAGFWVTAACFAAAWTVYGTTSNALAYAGAAAATNLLYAGTVAALSTLSSYTADAITIARVYVGIVPVHDDEED